MDKLAVEWFRGKSHGGGGMWGPWRKSQGVADGGGMGWGQDAAGIFCPKNQNVRVAVS